MDYHSPVLEVFTWFCVLLNINHNKKKLNINCRMHAETRNTTFCIACIHFQCNSTLLAFLFVRSHHTRTPKISEPSTAFKIKCIFLKFTFKAHSKFTCDLSPPFKHTPLSLCGQLSRVHLFPHSALYCPPSNACALPPALWTNPHPFTLHWLKAPLIPPLLIAPKPTRLWD